MIVVEQVVRRHERGYLKVRYSGMDGVERVCLVDLEDLSDRLLEFKRLTGRTPGKAELRDILVQMVYEIRRRKAKLRPTFDLTELIGVDLEGEAE